MATKIFKQPHSLATVTFAGAPTDADFEKPVDGLIAIGNNGTSDAVYVRVGGVWKAVAVA